MTYYMNGKRIGTMDELVTGLNIVNPDIDSSMNKHQSIMGPAGPYYKIGSGIFIDSTMGPIEITRKSSPVRKRSVRTIDLDGIDYQSDSFFDAVSDLINYYIDGSVTHVEFINSNRILETVEIERAMNWWKFYFLEMKSELIYQPTKYDTERVFVDITSGMFSTASTRKEKRRELIRSFFSEFWYVTKCKFKGIDPYVEYVSIDEKIENGSVTWEDLELLSST